jgi:hypothetical protein
MGTTLSARSPGGNQVSLKTCATEKERIQRTLQKELDWLRQVTGQGYDLTIKWVPDDTNKLSGEVRNGVIYLYEEDGTKAIKTLVHEFVDYLVSQTNEPYKVLANALIKVVNEDAYARKEKMVEAFIRLLEYEGRNCNRG